MNCSTGPRHRLFIQLPESKGGFQTFALIDNPEVNDLECMSFHVRGRCLQNERPEVDWMGEG